MNEEIFGPLLPVLEVESLDEAITFVNKRPKPLALYYFSDGLRELEKLLTRTSSGGVAVNETITHLINPKLPFGGVGASGYGAYHGLHALQVRHDQIESDRPAVALSAESQQKSENSGFHQQIKTEESSSS